MTGVFFDRQQPNAGKTTTSPGFVWAIFRWVISQNKLCFCSPQPVCRMSANGNVKRVVSTSMESKEDINIMLTV